MFLGLDFLFKFWFVLPLLGFRVFFFGFLVFGFFFSVIFVLLLLIYYFVLPLLIFYFCSSVIFRFVLS